MLTFKAVNSFQTLDNGLLRRDVTLSDASPAVEIKFTQGAFGQLQKRPHSQDIYICSGEFEFTIGSRVFIATADEKLLVPANTLFGCFCLTAGSLIEAPSPI